MMSQILLGCLPIKCPQSPMSESAFASFESACKLYDIVADDPRVSKMTVRHNRVTTQILKSHLLMQSVLARVGDKARESMRRSRTEIELEGVVGLPIRLAEDEALDALTGKTRLLEAEVQETTVRDGDESCVVAGRRERHSTQDRTPAALASVVPCLAPDAADDGALRKNRDKIHSGSSVIARTVPAPMLWASSMCRGATFCSDQRSDIVFHDQASDMDMAALYRPQARLGGVQEPSGSNDDDFEQLEETSWDTFVAQFT
jgi:hypothetical protein